MNKEVYRRLSKAERKLENTNRLRTNNSTLRIKYEGVKKLLEKKDKEIERLNNIINELEKWLNEKICLNKNDKDYINGMTFVGVNLQMYQMFLDKLQELKGSESNE